ncbi:hypothetical protein [uncultured Microbacterium sp.]|uniref:arsenate reductase/protein-tyrosine-phosphatase family protein n=1 Tax=uncultured Microbacterium sp. TaxID=191216 RepID=UPI0028EB7F6B|nr:hypothetical protein [uncultured Microbacterium sp.]
MAHRVLFVCEANVCRSPLMAFTFLRRAPQVSDGWVVTSAGTDARERDGRMCEVSAGLLQGADGAREYVHAHRTTPLTQERVSEQTMIIVAGMAERAAVARLDPRMRERTFTLRECVFLAREPVTWAEISATADASAVDSFDNFPLILNRRRGVVTLPRARPRWGWRAAVDDPLTVPDAHQLKHRMHVSTLRSMTGDVAEVCSHISRYMSMRE